MTHPSPHEPYEQDWIDAVASRIAEGQAEPEAVAAAARMLIPWPDLVAHLVVSRQVWRAATRLGVPVAAVAARLDAATDTELVAAYRAGALPVRIPRTLRVHYDYGEGMAA